VICFAFYANNTWVEAPFRMIFNVVLMLVRILPSLLTGRIDVPPLPSADQLRATVM
jgi:ABC-type phosphate/phosphonate transport system permease subunit